jgi:hypothetical protein
MSLDLYFRKNHDLFPSFRYFHWHHFDFFKIREDIFATQGPPPANVGKFIASVNDTSGHTITEIYIDRGDIMVSTTLP